jgi:hypothetical protein
MSGKKPLNPQFCPPERPAESSREIVANLFELQRLPTNVDNGATSNFVIESARFKYQFQSVIHIQKEQSVEM